ncbi:TonB-dependent receptor [Prevotella sp. KH2C16]|uniref:SusC/RagA family TonB-linked outer membrane protein n=1 Tax=Prevotella sp. KH2C16 TaxID=1855325 RepID=UPI0008F15FDC|nr:TonB-dependent receptor [Prevotella sp. KH2C16]SFG33508.1 TonB-linked outer membrane protein, SusC/RagA family [Prevotella sp. KH2C16]
MNLKKQRLVVLAGLCSCLLVGYAPKAHAVNETGRAVQQQTKKVTGTVSDAQGPIIGATVRVKGSQVATVTDIDGNYSINAPQGSTLQISYVGYVNKEFKVGAQSRYNVTLVEDNNNLDEVVVVGYGAMKKSDLAGASTSLDESTLKSAPVTNVDDALQGRVAGIQSLRTSGQPGSAISVNVRGIATVNAGTDPLYVVDGVIWQGGGNSGASLGLGDALGNGTHSAVSPLSLLSPQDIVSMEVLKDASATAIYGAQGANGVVLITTKRGKAGEAKFTYNGSVTASRQNRRLDILNLRGFAEYYNDIVAQGEIAASQADPAYSDPSILGIGTNWQDAIFQTALSTKHQLSAEGGTDKVKYYVSGNYDKQDGTIIGSNFKRLGFRTNLDAQLKKWLKLGVNLSFSKTHESLKLADSDEGLINYSLNTPPDIQIYNIDGGYSSVSKEGFINPNPIAMALEQDILLDRQGLNGSVYADVTPIKHITWHIQYGFDINSSKGDTFVPVIHLGTWNRDKNQSRIQKNSGSYWSLNNYVTYANQFGKHSVSAMLGQEAWESKYDYMSTTGTGLPSNIVHNPSLGTGDPMISNGWGSSSMASFFTRETYNYDDRYLATYTFRYDGSSNFGPNKRWAPFHSIALAWRFSNEKFIQDFAGKWLSNGKLRLGWGQTGNSNIGGYLWGSRMSVMGSGLGTSYRPANLKNLDIQWETQEQFNVGLDLGFLNNRLNITADWYRKESKNMLMMLNLPSIMGTSGNGSSALAAPYGNYGDILNSGIEVTIDAKPVYTKDFDWTANVNFSVNKNELKSLSGSAALLGYGQWSDPVSRTVPGMSLYHYYGYEVVGVYQSFEDILNSPVDTRQQANPIVVNADGTKSWNTDPTRYSRTNTTYVGDLKFRDVNKDGVIDDNDKTDLGDPMPKLFFGINNTFRYKNFDLNIFLQGSAGGKVFNYLKKNITHMNSMWQNQLSEVDKRARLTAKDGNLTGNWYDNIANVVVANPDAVLPRASLNDPNDNDAISSRYIESASYLRLKSITLGYTFDKKLIQKIGLTNLRLSLNATNLFTITGYDGYDPEIGLSTASSSGSVYNLDNGRYPLPTSVTFNVNLSF